MKHLLRRLRRVQANRTIARGSGVSLRSALRLWSLSDVIYIGPVGAAGQVLPECQMFRQICDDSSVSDEECAVHRLES